MTSTKITKYKNVTRGGGAEVIPFYTPAVLDISFIIYFSFIYLLENDI